MAQDDLLVRVARHDEIIGDLQNRVDRIEGVNQQLDRDIKDINSSLANVHLDLKSDIHKIGNSMTTLYSDAMQAIPEEYDRRKALEMDQKELELKRRILVWKIVSAIAGIVSVGFSVYHFFN